MTNALENSPVVIREKGKDKLIGFIYHVCHRNATLYYGDIIITDKRYSKKINIESQRLIYKEQSIDKAYKVTKVISYVSRDN
jgi:hypothetical protein